MKHLPVRCNSPGYSYNGYSYLHFHNEETEAQGGEAICPRYRLRFITVFLQSLGICPRCPAASPPPCLWAPYPGVDSPRGSQEGEVSGGRRPVVRREERKVGNWRGHSTCSRRPDGETRSVHSRRGKPPAVVTPCKLSPNHWADRDGFPGLAAQLSFLKRLMGEGGSWFTCECLGVTF